MQTNFKHDAKFSLLYRTKLSYRRKLDSYLNSKYKENDDKSTHKNMRFENNISIFSNFIYYF